MRLNLAIDRDRFASDLANEVATGGLAVVDAIERLLAVRFEETAFRALAGRLVKPPRVRVHAHYYRDRFANLSELRSRGYETWYPELHFATRKDDTTEVAGVDATGFVLSAAGQRSNHRYTRKALKTQVNHVIRLDRVAIGPAVFREATRILQRSGTIAQPYIANLTVGWHSFVDDRLDGFRVVSFDHVITGERTFCRCHSEAHASMLAEARARLPQYVSGSWPHRVIALLDRATYSERVCHFCVAEQHGHDVMKDWYGDQIRQHSGPYVDALVRGIGMDRRTATAEARRRLSISRWVREDELYALVTRLFPENTVQREASPPWLGQQRLDIYLPELALAIEHQGEQHYQPIEAFGGAESFAATRERDDRKRALCRENGVTVVDVRYDAPLTLPSLRSRLRRWLGL